MHSEDSAEGRGREVQKTVQEKIEDYEYSPEHLPTKVGWFDITLPPTCIERLWQYVNDPATKNYPAIQSLAGNISKSYYLEDVNQWFMKNYLEFMCYDYVNIYDHNFYGELGERNFNKHPLHLDSFWVNYQYENVFNPMHCHAGIFSFVVFMKIPTHWQDQHRTKASHNSNIPCAGDFSFTYLDALGTHKIEPMRMSPERDGTCLLYTSPSPRDS